MVRSATLLGIALAIVGCVQPSITEKRTPRINGGGEQAHPPGIEIMPVARVQELVKQAQAEGRTLGATGYSVFHGARIEKFDAQVIDIMANFLPQRHLILVRLKEDNPVVAKAGVIAGMSGSPLYIDGKMIGALAYAMGRFGKEAVAGIMPIEYMIEDARRATVETGMAPRYSELGLTPVETPIMVSGISGRTLSRITEELKSRNMVVVPSGSGSLTHEIPDRFSPGSAIGAVLVDGDMDMTGIGTVTYVEGDEVIAFGHPFFGTGTVDMPIATASIHTVFPSINLSFKMGSPVKVVGALTQDRATCIAGLRGRSSRMIPVSIEYRNLEEKLSRTMKVRIVRDPDWFPFLLRSVLSSGLETFDPTDKPRTTLTRMKIKLEGGREAVLEDLVASNPVGGATFSGGTAESVTQLLQILRNPHEKAAVESIEVVNEHVAEAKVAVLREAWALAPEVAEGAAAIVRLRLSRWRESDDYRDIEIPLPRDAAAGTEVTIEIAGGSHVDPQRPPATSLDEMLESLKKIYRPTSVVATIGVPGFTFLYKGRTLDRVPSSMAAQLIPGLVERGIVAVTPHRKVVDTDWIIKGAAQVTIRVK
jgi:hypothetical protein